MAEGCLPWPLSDVAGAAAEAKADQLKPETYHWASWVWALKNGTAWQQLNTVDSDLMTAADIDGSGRSDVVISLPGYGSGSG
jgi:hypothetical protein